MCKSQAMGGAARREAVLALLRQASGPVSASALARSCSVSRQIIVGDVALLRAGGIPILSTPRGYLLSQQETFPLCKLACRHGGQDLERELNIMVDNGCTVVDVSVEHPVYGQLTGQLQLSSRYDVQEFLRLVEREGARPLSLLTGGIHLHTLRCPDKAAFARVRAELKEAGFLVEE